MDGGERNHGPTPIPAPPPTPRGHESESHRATLGMLAHAFWLSNLLSIGCTASVTKWTSAGPTEPPNEWQGVRVRHWGPRPVKYGKVRAGWEGTGTPASMLSRLFFALVQFRLSQCGEKISVGPTPSARFWPGVRVAAIPSHAPPSLDPPSRTAKVCAEWEVGIPARCFFFCCASVLLYSSYRLSSIEGLRVRQPCLYWTLRVEKRTWNNAHIHNAHTLPHLPARRRRERRKRS